MVVRINIRSQSFSHSFSFPFLLFQYRPKGKGMRRLKRKRIIKQIKKSNCKVSDASKKKSSQNKSFSQREMEAPGIEPG